ncbi:MAG TPA: hypothetical protein VME17_12415 [Bryobacteraceae bacterium]|nr:hypothetical protein [Bryobacteraceae bacterium]
MKLHHVRCTLFSICCAALLSGAPANASGPHSAASPHARVIAVVLPQGGYSPIAVSEMGHEAARILMGSGVALRWHLGPTQVSDAMLVVVRLHGHCEMDESSAPTKPSVLGWSDEVDGEILPFTSLACDNIRGLIQSTVGSGGPLPANVMLGRAMGRVLAHELYHVVADTAKHGNAGVAQRALSARELTSSQLNLQPPDLEAIRNSLRETRR